MIDTNQRRHGLESFLASGPDSGVGAVGVSVRLLPDLGHINLRGDPMDAEFIATASSELGQELPVAPNSMSSGAHHVYWLGPNEWLIVTLLKDTQDLLVRLRESLAGQHASVTDVSGGQIALRFAGPGVRDVLAKGCTLDFRPERFVKGCCAQSGLAKANVLIGLVDDQPGYEIVIRRSFAEYLVLWLRHAAREYEVKFSVG